MVVRSILKNIQNELFQGKIILIMGPRQVGKSTLSEKIINESKMPYLILNGDDADVRILFQEMNEVKLRRIFGTNKLILIDEAQRIENIGLTLKIAADKIKITQK